MKSSEDLCVLGGLFIILGYALYLFMAGCRYLFAHTTWFFFDFMLCGLENIAILISLVFFILFFVCLLGKKVIFVQKITKNFPKISVYLFYLGWIGYVLYVIDFIIILVAYYAKINEIAEEYLLNGLQIMNVFGILGSLIISTQYVFFSNKSKTK